jgi:hypothetical protein
MAVQRRTNAPVGITNAQGQPEIVLEIDGLILSMAPPAATPTPAASAPPADDPTD